MSKKQEKEEAKRQATLLAEAKDKKSRYLEFWKPIYDETEKHRRFTLLGEQLSPERKAQLGLTNPMQPNLLLTYANHEANKTLQTDYRGRVTPNGGGANAVAARERQEVLRGLQRTNNINQIFNQARRDQIAGGIAYSIAVVDYAGKRGFGKTLKDEYLDDYQNVLPDINVKSCTFEDAKDFLYKKEVSISDWEDETGHEPRGWGEKKKKDLWYYWVREDIKDTEYLLEDSTTQLGSKLGEDMSRVKKGVDEEPLSRPVTDYSWCFYKIDENFTEIYEEAEWKGSYCPLVACTGRKVVAADGKIHYQPLTQFAEEAQEIYTILENIICLRLSRSPFSKWKVALESMNIKAEDLLGKASVTGTGTIWYKHLDDAGNLIPPPEETEPHVLDPILINLQQEQRVKIQQIFGIFEANLGDKSNEQSGIAIERRAKGGDLSNYDLQFNYTEYVKQVARVKLDLIPKYLKAPQQLAFVDEEDQAVLKWVNTTGGVQFSPDEEYSISIEAMPISETAREEEAHALMAMAKVIPIIAQNPQAVALIVRAQPGRYAGQIADFIANGNPEVAKAQAMIGELQGKLQQVLQQAQLKQSQDALAIAGLKQAFAGLKQQMAAMKQLVAIKDATVNAQSEHAEAENALEALLSQVEAIDKDLDRQVEQYKAESGRITAEASMLRAVGDLTKSKEPQALPPWPEAL